jgi:hypothetical protein
MSATATPFALLVEIPAPPVNRTPAYTYDKSRQLNVTAAGDAVIDVSSVAAPSHTHNHKGWKKDDDWASPDGLFGPTFTHNASGHKKDDD